MMKKNNLRKKRRGRHILAVMALVIAGMLLYALIWTKSVFGNVSFAQILFHLTVPLEGTDTSLVKNFVLGMICAVLLVLVIVHVPYIPDLFKKIRKGLDKNKSEKQAAKKHTYKKKIRFLRIFYKKYFSRISACMLVIVLNVDIIGFGIHSWVWDQIDSSEIFENYYVDSKTANITFPEDGEKKNLIYILSESLEATYADKANGGCMDENLIPNLTALAKENTHFSSSDNLAGATEVEGTCWTIAAMVSQMTGVPLKLPIRRNGYGEYAEFLPGITSLGELLEQEGYVNEIMIGSERDFSGLDNFYTQHGNYKIFDYDSAVEANYIREDYYRFWGFEDSRLFKYAQIELEELSKNDAPFNLIINTIDLHTPEGYWCTKCRKNHGDNKYMDEINCQDKQIYEFVEWCKTQDFYEDTVIIIAGDHLSMASIVEDEYAPDDYERTTYHVIINSDTEPVNTTNRQFTTMDMYPTILASLGCKIEGDRLGIGTNLYSDKKTVMEEMGKEEFMDEISKNSELYNKNILKIN